MGSGHCTNQNSSMECVSAYTRPGDHETETYFEHGNATWSTTHPTLEVYHPHTPPPLRSVVVSVCGASNHAHIIITTR